MLHLRLVAPAERAPAVLDLLLTHPAVTNVVVLPGAGHQPEGDLVLADVAREAASDVLALLRGLSLDEHGSIAVEEVDLSLSTAARAAERRAPGYGSDAVVWEDLEARVREDTQLSAVQLLFYGIATALAGIAVLLDSAVLVVGAMIVGPEFGALAGISAGLVRRQWRLVRRSVRAVSVGLAIGVVATVVLTWLLNACGLVDEGLLTRDRPQTGFIYAPDALSFVVAFLAGLAGMVALTAARSGAVIGVLVSVTTIPAAGNVAVALAFAATTGTATRRSTYLQQALTSAEQLVLNTAAIVLAGALVLLVQRGAWSRVRRR